MRATAQTSTPRNPLTSPAFWWKALGVAGVAGLVATGALSARDQRRRAAYTPEEIRRRLHERHAQAEAQFARREVVLESDIHPLTMRDRLDMGRRRLREQWSFLFDRSQHARPTDREAP